MHAFVVAVEYRGPDITVPGGMTRIGTCEHAFDLESATLIAHRPEDTPRVGFPTRQRAWNTEPEFSRCPQCESAVHGVIRALVRAALESLNLGDSQGRTAS